MSKVVIQECKEYSIENMMVKLNDSIDNNEVMKLLKSHTSIRKFNERKITDEQVQHIIESAMQGATAGNMYESFGFKFTGQVFGSEHIMRLDYENPSVVG
jgi:peptide subunit release factor 1 (eRF1)